MADQKLSDLTEDTAPTTDDLLYLVGDPGGTPVDRKAQAGFLLGSLLKENHINGFITSNNATDGDHDIDFGQGTATVTDGTDYTIATTSSTVVKQLDASWAVGTNQGGLDTGSIAADTWYHLWVIMRSDTHVVDFLFSTSATSPTMPTSYDFKRRIGAVLTDGSSNILAYYQLGNHFFWEATQNDISVTSSAATSWTSVTGILTPDDVRTKAVLSIAVGDASTSRPYVTVWHGGYTAPTTFGHLVQSDLTNTANTCTMDREIWTTAASPAAIQYFASASTVDFYVRTLGWIDPRGGVIA